MELSNFARIGKSPLIKAIGLQQNHKDIYYTESQELDRAASGCFACPNYKNIEYYEFMPAEIQQQACSCCDNCPHAVYKTVYHQHQKYINEKNMYGNAPRLKGIALKLFVIYHFKNPDDNGLVQSLSPKKLAAYLGCTVRSIRNANQKLQEYGYIMLGNDGFSKNYFHVILTEYKTYALTAKEGGRGYATFSQQFLDELIKLEDLNQLRIYLRTALELDTNRNPMKELRADINYSTLRSYLPRYCKPNVIRKALSFVSDIFHVVFDEHSVTLKMNSKYHGRRVLEKTKEQNTQTIRDYIEKIDTAMKHVNNAIIGHLEVSPDDLNILEQAGIRKRVGTSKMFVPFDLSDDDYNDLGLLGATYSCNAVIYCIGYIYSQYRAAFSMQSIGALVRTILKTNIPESDLLNLVI